MAVAHSEGGRVKVAACSGRGGVEIDGGDSQMA
jgi:hypothetical protein